MLAQTEMVGAEQPTSSTPAQREMIFKDVVGQFPQLKSYNQGTLVFGLNDNISKESVTSALETAINKIVAKVSWLGDQVVCVGKVPGNSGEFKTAPWPVESGFVGDAAKRLLHVKDRTNDCPSYKELVQKGCPLYMLDGNLLCPLPSFPLSYDEAQIGPAPVVAVQASFIKGGVILNISNQHNMMDAGGVYVFIAFLATALQGEEFPQNIVDGANFDRSHVIPLLEPGQPIRDHSHLLMATYLKNMKTNPSGQQNIKPSRWACFNLSKEYIPRIKDAASVKADWDPSVKFISTNDALSSFYWKRLAAVRLANGSVNSSAKSKFSRAIDARSAVGAPQGYMGQMVYHAATHLSYGELAEQGQEISLSAIASRMRIDLNASNNEWAVRSYATFIAGIPDKTTIVYAGGINFALDVGSSAMPAGSPGSMTFGLLGVPTFTRRPSLTPLPGFMYVFPPDRDTGDSPVLVCLSDEDLEGLKNDSEWGAYTQLVG